MSPDTSNDDTPRDEALALPHLPPVRSRPVQRLLTKHLLKLRLRELTGRGFGMGYYAPRVGVILATLFILCGGVLALIAVRVAGMPRESAFYGLRRELEAVPVVGLGGGADALEQRATRRLADLALTTSLDDRRTILRDFEGTLVQLDDRPVMRGDDATRAVIEPRVDTHEDAARMLRATRARRLEEEAIILASPWLPRSSPQLQDGATWVLEADRAMSGDMGGTHDVAVGMSTKNSPLETMSLDALLSDENAYGPALAPTVVRLRALALDGSPFVTREQIDAYARFILGGDR